MLDGGKFEYWNELVQTETEALALMDCDMLVLRPLEPIFDDPDFDIAYTVRPGPIPFNSGVVYVRPNERSRAFFSYWGRMARWVVSQGSHGLKLLEKYAGVQQYAFSLALEEVKRQHDPEGLHYPTGPERWDLSGCKMKAVQCAEWNSTGVTWKEFSPGTRVIHVKALLRDHIFGDREAMGAALEEIKPLLEVCAKYGLARGGTG